MDARRLNMDTVRDTLRERPEAEDGEEAGAPERAPAEPVAREEERAGGTEGELSEQAAGADPGAAEEAQRAADEAATDDAPAQDGAAAADEDPLALAQRERDQYLELARRTQADFENFRKRAAKDVQASGARARANLIREMLPVVDNLERALASAPPDAQDAFVEGVRLVYLEVQGVLERAGVQPIAPAGEQFDPNVHEALSMREQDGAQSGVVLDVVEKGYRTADNVIRPARVVVAA